MPDLVRRVDRPVKTTVLVAVLVWLLVLVVTVVLALLPDRPAGAQDPGVQLAAFPGAEVLLPAFRPAERTLTTFCEPGGHAVSGGWYLSGDGAGDVRVLASYASAAPSGEQGGVWLLHLYKPAGTRAATVVPYVTCAYGVGQLPQ
jgi:hypothetical protein